jgi:branched-chain amino acid transport system substrate-binding protein
VQVGGHKYSFFYCIEATPCTAAQDYITKKGLAAKAGLQGVGDQPISLAGSNFTQQCATAKSKGADVVIIGAGATAVTAIGRDCANQGYHPIYITEALAAVNSLAQDPNLSGLILGNVAFPYMSSSTPAEQAFQAAVKRYAPNLDVSGAAAGAWASGELFKKALLNLGQEAYGDVTPALVAKAMHTIKGEALGGLAPGKLDFSGSLPVPDRCAFITQIKGGAFVAPIGDQQICEP